MPTSEANPHAKSKDPYSLIRAVREEKLNFEPAREGHEFIRAVKSLKMDARFSA